MRCINKMRPAIAGLLVLLCGCLTGCSVSFCGFRGKGEEFAFICQEEAGEVEDHTGGPEHLPEPVRAAQPESDQTDALQQETEPAKAEPAETPEVSPEDGRININTAGVEELTTLKGVGESRANAIIAFREEHGSFENPEDIMQIAGIKEGIYAKIKDQIKVR